MQRIAGATVSSNLHGSGKDGFTNGTPGSVAPTVVSADWLNSVQEQLARAVELFGMELKASDNEQLARAINVRAVAQAVNGHVARTSPGGTMDYAGVAYDATSKRWVLAPEVGQINYSSDGGVTWVNALDPPCNAVAASGAGRFVAVGDTATIITGTDGSAWTTETAGGGFTGDLFGVCYGSSLWVAVGASGEIQTASDPTGTWTHRACSGTLSGFYAVAYGNGAYIATGVDTARGVIQRSTNGTSWTNISDGTSTQHHWRGVATDGAGTWIVVGYDATTPKMKRSTDNGLTWSDVTLPSGVAASGDALLAIAFSPNDKVFVAVGANGLILVSGDGSSWRNIRNERFTDTLTGIGYGDGSFVMVGPNEVIRQTRNFSWAP